MTEVQLKKLIHEIRLKNKRSLKKVRTLIYDVAQFRNLLLLFQYDYQRIFNSFLLNQSLIYSMLANRPRVDKYQEKLPMITQILEHAILKEWIEKLKQQKEKIRNNYVIQSIIRQTLRDFKSFFKAIKRYQQNPSSFHGTPRPPRPKKLSNLVYSAVECNRMTYTRLDATTLKIKLRMSRDGTQSCSIKVKLPPHVKETDISSIRFKMIGTDIYLHVVHSSSLSLHNLSQSHHGNEHQKQQKVTLTYHAGIDLGLDTLVAMVSDNPHAPSVLVSGKELKSFNQWFNKKKARLQALRDTASSLEEKKRHAIQLKRLHAYRYRRMTNDIHKITHKLAELLRETGNKVVFIGKNVISSKNGIKLGKKTNQHLVSIPYRKLVALLN